MWLSKSVGIKLLITEASKIKKINACTSGQQSRYANTMQCPKLRVHPAPGAHISAAGCTIFGGVHPECARYFESLSLLHSRRVHGENPGCTVLREVHPVGAKK